MNTTSSKKIAEARAVALEVLLYNCRHGRNGLPRTAAWGYPEPYTRDLLIASLGILVSGNGELVESLGLVLRTLANNQSPLGHMPSLIDAPYDRGASDTTPLFLLCLAFYRKATNRPRFLAAAARKSLTWMAYQSPDDSVMVAQQPTSDWRDEQWVEGYGLYVNTLVYAYLKLYGQDERAQTLACLMNRVDLQKQGRLRFAHEGLKVPKQPYFAFWSYKIHRSDRFDLLGNSLAMLGGIASQARCRKLVNWIENECASMRERNLLLGRLPPCLFPYISRTDADWRPRYAQFNVPGEYHNGGVWPFVCGFYVAALVAAKRFALAEKKLLELTDLVRPTRVARVPYGFNEWFKAQDGKPRGQDWQTWSASMYLYAAECVATGRTPFFDVVRKA